MPHINISSLCKLARSGNWNWTAFFPTTESNSADMVEPPLLYLLQQIWDILNIVTAKRVRYIDSARGAHSLDNLPEKLSLSASLSSHWACDCCVRTRARRILHVVSSEISRNDTRIHSRWIPCTLCMTESISPNATPARNIGLFQRC